MSYLLSTYLMMNWKLMQNDTLRPSSPFRWGWGIFCWWQLLEGSRNPPLILLCQCESFCWKALEGMYLSSSGNHLALVKLSGRNQGPSNGLHILLVAQRRRTVAGPYTEGLAWLAPVSTRWRRFLKTLVWNDSARRPLIKPSGKGVCESR